MARISSLFFLLLLAIQDVNAQILNGGFESGLSDWTATGGFSTFTNAEKAHNGTKYAFTGVTSDLLTPWEGTLSQVVTIPSNVSAAELKFFLWIASDEDTSGNWDILKVQVLDLAGNVLRFELGSYSNVQKSGPLNSTVKDYKERSVPLTDYIGQTIRIQFRSFPDSSINTIFRLDDVSLVTTQVLPNLATFQPAGWSNKIVVSKTAGTSADDSYLTTADSIFVDWAYINNGAAATHIAPNASLYLDGILKETIPVNGVLLPNFFTYRTDFSLGNLPAGNHFLELIVDPQNSISESNESNEDNRSLRAFYVADVPLPNVETLSAANISATTATIFGNIADSGGVPIQDRRFDWGTNSNGLDLPVYSANISVTGNSFSTTLSGLQPNTVYYFRAWAQNGSLLNSGLGTGWDNGEILSFQTTPAPRANLAHYQPPGWPERMVLSTSPGTSMAVAAATTDDNFYLDYAFENQGLAATGLSFQVRIEIDGVVKSTSSFPASLAPGETRQIIDESLGKLSVGIHVISLHLDTTNSIVETEEISDNYYEVTVAVTGPPGPVITITSPAPTSSWPVGSTIPIAWTLGGMASGVTGIRVSFQMNGVQFYTIPLPASALFLNWTVPSGFVTSAGSILVEALGQVSSFKELAITTTGALPTSLYAVITVPGISNPRDLVVPLNRPVTFSGQSSSGSITNYAWQFSDGFSIAGSALTSITHTFTKALDNGSGWARLTISSPGSSNLASISFALQGAGPPEIAKSGSSKDPINTATGNFILGLDLMPVQARALPFIFQAYYGSMSYRPQIDTLPASTPGSLGYGWTHNFETHVEPLDEDGVRTAIISFGDGHAEKYTLSSAGQWQSEPGIYNRLEEAADGRYSLITHSQIRHLFDAHGRLDSISDRNGNALDIVWESFTGAAAGAVPEMRIQKIILPGGPPDGSAVRAVLFRYRSDSPRFLRSLEDPLGRFVLFEQDANGDLTSYTNERSHTVSYSYDGLHQLKTGKDALNRTFVRNDYGADRRVIDQWDALNNRTHLDYSFPADASLPRVTTVTRLADPEFAISDQRNEVTTDIHNSRLQLVERRVTIEDPDNDDEFLTLIEKEAYDPDTGDLTESRNRRGHATCYTHVEGNLTRLETPDGAVTTYDYADPRHPTLPTLITYPDPAVKKRLEYDAKGNLVLSTFPYDAAHPLDNRRAMVPDDYGQITSITDAEGVTQSFKFDEWGRNWKWLDGDEKPHLSEFDANGRLTAKTDPRGHRIDFARNEVGKVWQTSRPDPAIPGNLIITEIEFDDNEMPVLSRDPLFHLFHSRRDEQGRVWKEENHEGHTTVHRFDAFGREFETENAKQGVTSRTFNFAGYLMSEASPAPSTNVVRYRRDKNGNATEVVDGDGVRITTEFDKMDRPVITRRWKSATGFDEVRASYNLMGQKEWVEANDDDGIPRRTSFYYDSSGNHYRTVPPTGPEFTFGYDKEGHQTSATHDATKTRRDYYTNRYQLKERKDENGHVEKFFYDDAGNLERHVDADLQETAFFSDSLDRLTRINPPTGPPITFLYDAASRRYEMTDTTGTTTWTHTSLHQVKSIETPGGLKLAFHYDPLGTPDSIAYPGNRVASYQTDKAGRFESVKDWEDRLISQFYTAGDRPLKLQFPNGVQSGFGHDIQGRLDNIIHQKEDSPPLIHLAYQFNSLGRLRTVPDILLPEPEGEYPRTYGDANELLTIAGVPVVHDNRGNITSANLDPAAAVTDSLAWDYASRLTGGTVGGAPFSNTFNGLGRRVSTTRAGVTTGFLIDDRPAMPRIMAETDAAGNPTAFYLYAGDALLARLLPDGTPSYYHTDRQRNVVLLTDGTGSTAAHYQYDPFGVPVASTGPLAPSNRFRYLGGLGVWDNLDGTLDARARTYHPRLSRFLSRDALYGSAQDGQSLNRYAYGLNDPYGYGDASGFKPVTPNWYGDTRNAYSTPAVATSGSGTLAALHFGATYFHYEVRHTLNGEHPSLVEVQNDPAWRSVPFSEAKFHQNDDDVEDLKFIHPSGREAVFDGSTGQIMNDPRHMATFNVITMSPKPATLSDVNGSINYAATWLGHGFWDVLPYLIEQKVFGGNGNTRE